MKVKVLIENESISEDLISEHGLSLYIEVKNKKILFDTGMTGSFIKNAYNCCRIEIRGGVWIKRDWNI